MKQKEPGLLTTETAEPTTIKDSGAGNPNGSEFSPALLRTESKEAFEKLLGELNREVQPTTFTKRMYTKDVADLTWEIMRLRRSKAGIINNAIRGALEKFLQRFLLPPGGIFLHMIEKHLSAYNLAYDWFYSQEAKDRVSGLLEEAGFDMGAVEAEAVRRVLPDIEKLDRLIVSAEARRDKYLRSLAQSEESLATKLEGSSDRLLAADSVPGIAASNPAN
jgi:hypothetical protein